MNKLAADDRKPTLADDLLIDAEDTSPPAPVPARGMRALMLAVGLMLVALNLRPALSSLGPILPDVIRDTGITAVGASILTTAPVLCLGLFGFLAPKIAGRLGTERAILAFLVVLAAGTALRGVLSFPGLLAGSIVAGAAIGIIGVLLPGLVKRDFPDKASLMTGVYTMALCAGAAFAAGSAVPFQQAMGGSWPAALAVWAIPALVAALVWLPMAPRRGGGSFGDAAARRQGHGLWRDPLAWQVTLYMGLQSAVAYMVFGWVAPMLRDRGLDPVMAGLVVSCSILVQVPAALVSPLLATRRPKPELRGGAADGLHDRRADGAFPCAARQRLGLGGPAGDRAGRQLRRGADHHRAPVARRPCRGPSFRHGAERRLYPGRDGAAGCRRAA